MSGAVYSYPAAAALGTVLPKSKIYENANPVMAVKDQFVAQVQRITWAFKLAPQTTNLKPAPGVQEIQVFHIELKNEVLSEEVLQAVDHAIPFPTVFELYAGNRVKIVAAYKRPSAGTKWTQSRYYDSGWQPGGVSRSPLPMVLDLGSLYARLVQTLLPHPVRPGEDMRAVMERLDAITSLDRELVLLRGRLRNEKQFNRRVELNNLVRAKQIALQGLTAQRPPYETNY